jgi:hypothetical protein
MSSRNIPISRRFASRWECRAVVRKSQRRYDGFRHFVSSINASQDSLMPMFSLYCDDSGTDASSEIAVAGCCIATVQQCQEFKRNWENINQREHFGIFHMADFVAKREQFAESEWQNQEKRDRTMSALLGVIRTRAAFVISTAVVKSAYDEVVTGDLRERMGKNHYTFAVRHCVAIVDSWRARHRYTEPLQYVFDRMSKGSGDINDTVFKPVVLGGEAGLQRYGIGKDGWSFQDKSVVIPLQAADIWAWENFRYAARTYFKPNGARAPIRESYRFLRQRVPSEVKYHNKQSLLKFVDLVEKEKQSKV